jgi:hypothetical protein
MPSATHALATRIERRGTLLQKAQLSIASTKRVQNMVTLLLTATGKTPRPTRRTQTRYWHKHRRRCASSRAFLADACPHQARKPVRIRHGRATVHYRSSTSSNDRGLDWPGGWLRQYIGIGFVAPIGGKTPRIGRSARHPRRAWLVSPGAGFTIPSRLPIK